MDLATLACRRQLWAQTVVITTLCAQYATLLMASATDNSKAQWDEDEIVALLDYLLDHKSAIGEAGSFKMPTFRAAADSISGLLVNGPPKMGKMCRTKWRTVSEVYMHCFILAWLTYFVFSLNPPTVLFRSTRSHRGWLGTMQLEQVLKLRRRKRFGQTMSNSRCAIDLSYNI
jgi:hypothetical protein